MKLRLLILTACLAVTAVPVSAVTLSLTITELVAGTPSPQFAGVGPGSSVTLQFDLPEASFQLYPLSATFIGLPTVATGRGFIFGPPGATQTPVSLFGSTGDLGNPDIVQLREVTLTGATPVDLTQYTTFVPGVGFVPLPLHDAIEAAALAGDLTQGTIVLVDQVGPVAGNFWTYNFVTVPEPSSAVFLLAAAPLLLRRRRDPARIVLD